MARRRPARDGDRGEPLGEPRTRALLWCLTLARALTATSADELGPAQLGVAGICARAREIATMDPWTALGLPIGLLPFRDEVATIFAHMTRAQQTLCDPEAKRQWMEGHGIGLRQRPREEVVREIEDLLAKGEWTMAETASRRLVESDPNDSDALAFYAWSSARGGEAPEDALRSSLVASTAR